MFWGQEEVDFLNDLGWKCNRCVHYFGVFHCQIIIERTFVTSIQCLPPAEWVICHAENSIKHPFAICLQIISPHSGLQACVHLIPIILNSALGLCLSRQEIYVTLGMFFFLKKVDFIVIIINPILPLQINFTSALLSL